MRSYTFYNGKLHNGIFLKKVSEYSEIDLFPNNRYLSQYSLDIPVWSDKSILLNANVYKSNNEYIVLKDKSDELIGNEIEKSYYLYLTLQSLTDGKVIYLSENNVMVEGNFESDSNGELKLFLRIPISSVPLNSNIVNITSDNFKVNRINFKSPYYFIVSIDFNFEDNCPNHLQFDYKINFFSKKDDDNRCLVLVKLVGNDDVQTVIKNTDRKSLKAASFPFDFSELPNIRFLAYNEVKHLKFNSVFENYLFIMRYDSQVILSNSNSSGDLFRLDFFDGSDLVCNSLKFCDLSSSSSIHLSEIL